MGQSANELCLRYNNTSCFELLKIQKQSTQTLPLFTDIIETEKYLQKLLKCQAAETSWSNKKWEEVQALLRDSNLIKVKNLS